MRLTVFFDGTYWIGIVEVERDSLLYVARHIFGPEPSEQEVYDFVQHDLLALQTRMTIGSPIESSILRQVNPKRAQRQVKRQLAQPAVSSKAQEAMRLQIEQNKHTAKVESREQREALKAHKYELGRQKAKSRHRGR